MGDENHIRTLGDYPKPSYEGYRNTIELLVGNNVVPLRSETIRLVQIGCSFHGLQSEDPNQHLKDFLKLMDSLDLDGENRERTRLQYLSEAWTYFKDLLQKVPHHGIDRWLLIKNFYDHVSFHLKYEIDRTASVKLRNKNTNESWEIIENLDLYDHEGWNDTKEFGSRPTPSLSSTHIPQAYVEEVYSNPRLQNQNEPPKQNPFSFHERTGPNPQPQALETTFEARVRDYMATHTERIERFENAIFKQREENSDRMTEMFRLLKELTINMAPKKVLIREEAKSPVTKSVNSISLIREEDKKSDKYDVATDDDSEKTNRPIMKVSVKEAETKNRAKNRAKNKPIKKLVKEEVVEAPNSQPVEYYLKHRINEKLIEGLVDNNRFNDSLSGVQLGKTKGKTYNLSPRGPVYEAILKKKITKKEDIRGNFEIPCNIGGLKHVNALVDQGSDVNVMPYSTYMKLTDERPAETNIRLFLASHLYIYPLGIAKDVLVDVAGYVYPIDFVILDIKEDKKRPFILETPFLTTAKAVIKFDKGTITLKSGKSKISFHRIPESPYKSEKGIKKDIEPIAPIMTVNRLVLEWEEKIKLHQEKEIEFNRWRNKNFKNERPALVKIGDEKDDEREVT
ncbi:MAK10-like protein [Tanacetum coccineum]